MGKTKFLSVRTAVVCAIGLLVTLALDALATPPPFDSVRRAGWKADRITEVFTAPAPADSDVSAARFAERDRGDSLKKLADEFFALVDEKALPDAVRLYRKGQYPEALAAFRDDFVERLREAPKPFAFQPVHPSIPAFFQFLNEADELLRNVVTLGVTDPEKQSTINLKLDIGAPGRSNWFYLPQGYTYYRLRKLRDANNVLLAGHPLPRIYYEPGFFNELLVAYAQTGEARYLAKWCEFTDAQYCDLKPRMTAAGEFATPDNNAEQYTRELFRYFCYLARHREGFAKDLSAPTLARFLLRFTKEELAGVMRVSRCTIPNRAQHMYSQHGQDVGVSFPAFKPFAYALRDSRRVREMQAVAGLLPDGGDIESSFNYSSCYPTMIDDMLEALHDYPFATREWLQERSDGARARADFLMRFRSPTGGYLYQEQFARRDFRDGIFKRWGSRTGDQVLEAVWGDGSREEPPFHSEAFPYSGYYILRQGWGKQDQLLSLAGCRPVCKSNFSPCNLQLNLQAYGRCMFLAHQRSGPLEVDGFRQLGSALDIESLPPAERGWNGNPFDSRYERYNSAPAWQTPLKNRWLDGSYFSLAEARYDGPFLHPREPKADTMIKGVTHQRIAIFLRDTENWLVIDRLGADKPHQYSLQWPLFFGDKTATKWPGFTAEKIRQAPKEHLVAQTAEAEGANLALYSVASRPLKVQKWGWQVAGQPGETLVGSILHPLPPNSDKALEVRPLTEAGVPLAFTAASATGGRVTVFGAEKATDLTNGKLKAVATLLVITQRPGEVDAHGLALDCSGLTLNGKALTLPGTNIAFTQTATGIQDIEPILTPLDRVEISPAPDVFVGRVDVALAHPAAATVDIRYTLDGSDPHPASPLYTTPIPLTDTAMVKARAFLKGTTRMPQPLSGTIASAVSHAVFTRQNPAPAVKLVGEVQPGLAFRYYEEDSWPMSPLSQPGLPVTATGRVTELFDTSARRNQLGFAFEYEGYLKLERDGVYSFHSPRELTLQTVEAPYDLRLFLDGQEWYPTTRLHGYGTWSVALAQGYHHLRVIFIDYRQTRQGVVHFAQDRIWDGTRPDLRISGPGLEPQPIPATMLITGTPPQPRYPRFETVKTTTTLDLPQLEARHIIAPTTDGSFFLSARDCLMLNQPEPPDFTKPGSKKTDTVVYEPSLNCTSLWGQHGNYRDYLCWGIDLAKPGEYLVKVTFAVRYADSKVRFECEDQSLEWAVPVSPAFREAAIGTIKLPAGKHVFRMRGTAISNKWAFLDLREIELAPVKP